MYESIQGYHSASSSTRKNLSPSDPSSSRANVGETADSSRTVLTEQKMLDHVSAMELRMMASYEEAKRASAVEMPTSKAGEMESGSERGSTIVAKHSSPGPFSSTILAGSFIRSSPQSPRGGKWVDVPQCPAVESCLVLSKLPLTAQDSLSSLESQFTKPPDKTDLVVDSGSPERGEKSKHGGREEKEVHNFLRPSSAAPGWSKRPAKSSKKVRKAGTARSNPFWNEQVDWTPGLALKYTLPQTDLIEVPT